MGFFLDFDLWHSQFKGFSFLPLGRAKKAEVNISTVGVDVCDWIYPKKTDFAFGRADNRPPIKFSTWDFGGQVRLGRVGRVGRTKDNEGEEGGENE